MIGEVTLIECDDDLSTGTNRSGDNVAVTCIDQIESLSQMLVPRHQAIGDRLNHEKPGTGKFVCRQGQDGLV